jgi:hypothetical protein
MSAAGESFPVIPGEKFLPGSCTAAVAINTMEKTDEDRVFEQGL